jgi:ferredoxin-NADP reductase/Na+-translocating ferredoxin:NAD+ oxidoreductase RnfD subunit
MYRLILYYLLVLLVIAALFSIFKVLPFDLFSLASSSLVILVSCLITNAVFARVYEVPVNLESAYITALILILIISPPAAFDPAGLGFLIWVSVWAMASKYILAIDKKHIFNPAAFAVVVTALTLHQSASWWVGSFAMFPFVVIGGMLVARKIQRFDLVISFLITALVTIVGFSIFQTNPLVTLQRALFDTPLFFFAFVMLTEPLTTPPKKSFRIAYAILIGFLFAPDIHVDSLYSTPELALLAGNIFSYLVSPKGKYILKLKEINQIGLDTYNFVFTPNRKAQFQPGQYFEWTLGYKDPDSRGNRRFFTIASSPTENEVQLGAKFYQNPSTYKQAMLKMQSGDTMLISQLGGDFTLPKNKDQKLAFIAGGIGITPFRSMIKYLLDTEDARSVVLFYSNNKVSEIVYKDIFDQAEKQLGLKTVYILTDAKAALADWQGCIGYINAEMVAEEVPDYLERLFYISGPHAMVLNYENVLLQMGVKKQNIKTDFFPGF